mmetsp:Transcript_2085/g.6315  ORF Transcript_2085/g.6315 Transcript_2085/m.6315 type:complete len:208 (+) Transcript_2085:190-813(+)
MAPTISEHTRHAPSCASRAMATLFLEAPEARRKPETQSRGCMEELLALANDTGLHKARECALVVAHDALGCWLTALGHVGSDGLSQHGAGLGTRVDAARPELPDRPHHAGGAGAQLALRRLRVQLLRLQLQRVEGALQRVAVRAAGLVQAQGLGDLRVREGLRLGLEGEAEAEGSGGQERAEGPGRHEDGSSGGGRIRRPRGRLLSS